RATRRSGGNGAADDLLDREELLRQAAHNPELRNLVPYAWDRRIALHPFNLDRMYALGGRRGRRQGPAERDEEKEVFKPTGRYAHLAERLQRDSDDDDDNDDDGDACDAGGGGGGASKGNGANEGGGAGGGGVTHSGLSPRRGPAPSTVTATTYSSCDASVAAEAVAVAEAAAAEAAAATVEAAVAGAAKPSARASRELRLLEPFGWDRRRTKHPA
ncbi:hypothetical protein Vretimale_19184, partial [Volvox reticuliferus]